MVPLRPLTRCRVLLLPALLAASSCGHPNSVSPPPAVDVPEVTSFSPSEALPGDTLRIQGEALADGAVDTQVRIGAAIATAETMSPGELRVIVPAGAQSAPLIVMTAAGADTSALYLVVFEDGLTPSVIDSMTPTAGPAGTDVTIRGRDFATPSLANHVIFNGVPAEVISGDEGRLLVLVPEGATPGPVAMLNARGRATAPDIFLSETGGADCSRPTVVSGTLSGAIYWSLAGCPYVVRGTLTVQAGAILTIQPGVVVKFEGPAARMQVDGTLIAGGDAVTRVVFTSYRDDAAIGDTNGDGIATMPAAGDWEGIAFGPGSRAELRGIDLSYGGAGGAGALTLDARAIVDDGVFASNLGYALVATATPATPDSVAISRSVFHGNARPLRVNASVRLGSTNVFHAGAGGNAMNAIFVAPGPTAPGAVAWTETEVPFALLEENTATSVMVSAGTSLDIGPGVVVKMLGRDMDFVVFGSLAAAGTTGHEVTFTSWRDDTAIGDSNGDGGATQAARGDWDSVELSHGSATTLARTRFLYGGSSDLTRRSEGALVAVAGARAEIDSCEVAFSASSGITLYGGEGSIHGASIHDNGRWGIRCSGSTTWFYWGAERLDAPWNTFAGNNDGAVFLLTP